VIHPGRRGWIAIARDASGASAYAVPAPAPTPPVADLAPALFDPIAARLTRARRVRVRAYGAWRSVDVHALPFRAGPLVHTVAVDYPVGVGGRDTRDARDRKDGVLVVGDPTSDLPSAAEEARELARTAFAGRTNVTLLVGDDATTAHVTAAMSRASTFHYAGHGVYAGLEGWESALPLANGGRLGIADVLALAPTPARVVLSGCDAARSEGDAEGLGLAQAFVTAGADEVLAPVRPVSDAVAARLALRLHREPSMSLAEALRAATLALAPARDDEDWAAFRVLAR
jgi:CHAT domain-containing protein